MPYCEYCHVSTTAITFINSTAARPCARHHHQPFGVLNDSTPTTLKTLILFKTSVSPYPTHITPQTSPPQLHSALSLSHPSPGNRATLPRLPPPPPPPGQPPIKHSLFFVMEGILKKYQQKFRKVREEMDRWEDLQSRLISQFSNASSIIGRLQMIGDKRKYGSLKCVNGIEDAVLQKQMESLETILLSIKKTMYLLISSVVSALLNIALKPSSKDLGALRQLLFDQPNIPRDKVQFIYDTIFAEDIC